MVSTADLIQLGKMLVHPHDTRFIDASYLHLHFRNLFLRPVCVRTHTYLSAAIVLASRDIIGHSDLTLLIPRAVSMIYVSKAENLTPFHSSLAQIQHCFIRHA